MSQARSRLYDDGSVAEHVDVAAAPVSSRGSVARTSRDAHREIDTLRALNAHLIRQIAVLKQREAYAQRLADRDGLTGLYNRRRMLELLDSSIADAAAHRHCVGLLFIDLDGFKAINDHRGHAAGDKLLITVAARVAGRARTGDYVCRYGGDEFTVILPRVVDLAAADQVADSIRKRVALPYRVDGTELHVTAAIGVSMYPNDGCSAAALLQRADESMYRAKARWTDRAAMLERFPAPARRRDDKPKRRVAVG